MSFSFLVSLARWKIKLNVEAEPSLLKCGLYSGVKTNDDNDALEIIII